MIDWFTLPAPNFAFGVIPEDILAYKSAFGVLLVEHYRFAHSVIGTVATGNSIPRLSSTVSDRGLFLLEFFISKSEQSGFHLRMGGCRGSFPPRWLNFPPPHTYTCSTSSLLRIYSYHILQSTTPPLNFLPKQIFLDETLPIVFVSMVS